MPFCNLLFKQRSYTQTRFFKTAIAMLLLFSLLFAGCTGTNPASAPAEEGASSGDTGEKGTEAAPQAEKEEEEEAEEQEQAPCPQEERAALEEERKQERGKFYVPLPDEPQEDNPPVKARGIYVTGNSVGLQSRFSRLMEMLETTELNSMVIDVKNDHGHITYNSDIELVQEINSDSKAPIRDLRAVLEELKEKDIYPIARVVVFRDPYLANTNPDWAIQRKEGGVWKDRKGMSWLDPYQKKVWDYSIAVAQEAALLGFREIQFDYVRFPENADRVEQEARFPARNDLRKEEVIREFLIYANEKLEDYNVFLSADVFGVISTSWGDSDDIGQTWEEIAPLVDYMCPMVYPSHYGPGYFGYSVPDAHPAGTVRHALQDALKRNAPLEDPGILRPWLQNFTAGWIRGNIRYGPGEIRAQIDAAHKLGIDEYLLWNAGNRYQPEALLTEEEAQERFEKYERSRKEAGEDSLGKTPAEAVENFLQAVKGGDWRDAFSLHRTETDVNYRTYREWFAGWNYKPVEFRVHKPAWEDSPSRTEPLDVKADLRLAGNGREFKLSSQNFEVNLQNETWRVTPSPSFYRLIMESSEPEGQGKGLSHMP